MMAEIPSHATPWRCSPGQPRVEPPRRNPWGHSRHSDVVKLPLDDAPAMRPDLPDELIGARV